MPAPSGDDVGLHVEAEDSQDAAHVSVIKDIFAHFDSLP